MVYKNNITFSEDEYRNSWLKECKVISIHKQIQTHILGTNITLKLIKIYFYDRFTKKINKKKTIILPGFRPGSDENVQRERRE